MKYLLNILAIMALSACAASTITSGNSFADPDWNGALAKSILVQVIRAPLDERIAIENGTVQSLQKAEVFAEQSYKVFLPTRDYSDSERKELLMSGTVRGSFRHQTL
jgi:hypothetical protein